MNLAPDDGLREKIEWVDRLYTSVLFLKRVGERDAKQELGGGTGDKLARTAKSARELANRLAAGEGGAEGDLDSLAGQLGDLEDVVRRTPGEGTEMEQGTLAFAMKEVTDSMRKLAELYGLVRT